MTRAFWFLPLVLVGCSAPTYRCDIDVGNPSHDCVDFVAGHDEAEARRFCARLPAGTPTFGQGACSRAGVVCGCTITFDDGVTTHTEQHSVYDRVVCDGATGLRALCVADPSSPEYSYVYSGPM